MLRLAIALVVLLVIVRIVWPQIRAKRAVKGERNAHYNRAEWERIKRDLEKK